MQGVITGCHCATFLTNTTPFPQAGIQVLEACSGVCFNLVITLDSRQTQMHPVKFSMKAMRITRRDNRVRCLWAPCRVCVCVCRVVCARCFFFNLALTLLCT